MTSVPSAPSVSLIGSPEETPEKPGEGERQITACVLVIGNEILSGRTVDANIPYIARGLNDVGVRLREVRVIPDVEDTIIETVNSVRGLFDYVFTTGGIGPTHDDITAGCIAKAFGVPLVIDAEARRRLEEHFPDRKLNEARLRMAHVPEGASLIDNPVSTAPGFIIGNVHVMAGVPKIMQAMFDGLKGSLRGGAPVLSRTVRSNLPEGAFAAGLGELQDRYRDVEIGSYPSFRAGAPSVSLVLRGTSAERLAAAAAEVAALLRELGGMAEEDPVGAAA